VERQELLPLKHAYLSPAMSPPLWAAGNHDKWSHFALCHELGVRRAGQWNALRGAWVKQECLCGTQPHALVWLLDRNQAITVQPGDHSWDPAVERRIA